ALTDEIALPTLRVSSSASSFRFATIASASACSRRERSVAGVLPQSPASAPRAASTARSTSASPAIAARARAASLAGSRSSRPSPAPGSVDSPLMKSPYSRSVAPAIAGGRYRSGHEERRSRPRAERDDPDPVEVQPAAPEHAQADDLVDDERARPGDGD